MTKNHLLAAALLAATAGSAGATVWLPAEGIWQIDGANGSGLMLDVRDDTIGIGLYTYDDAGNGVWYSGAGALVDGTLTAELTQFSRDDDAAPVAVDTLAISLAFDASAAGTLTIGDGEGHVVRHAAFGADYLGATGIVGHHGDIVALPDLQGRWLLTPTTSTAAPVDVEFGLTTVGDHHVTFDGSSPGTTIRARIDCVAAPDTTMPPYRCNLYAGLAITPPPLGEFAPDDLSATRIAGDSSDWIAFRVPDNANQPVSGIWQIAGRFGEGVTIDVRPDLVAVGVYGYDDAGDATWSLATGAIVDNVVEANLVSFSGGSCIGCEQADPELGTPRPLRIEFVGATRARLTIGDDAPLALSLLPFGTEYLSRPFAGDPLDDEFGPHLLPALTGSWVQTTIYDRNDDEPEPTLAAAFDFDDVETISIDGETNVGLLAVSGEHWGRADETDGTERTQFACEAGLGDDSADCDLFFWDDSGSPPGAPRDIADIDPWNVAGTRISGVADDGDDASPEPVYLFRIPPRPADSQDR